MSEGLSDERLEEIADRNDERWKLAKAAEGATWHSSTHAGWALTNHHNEYFPAKEIHELLVEVWRLRDLLEEKEGVEQEVKPDVEVRLVRGE